jgi:hypothetical protein
MQAIAQRSSARPAFICSVAAPSSACASEAQGCEGPQSLPEAGPTVGPKRPKLSRIRLVSRPTRPSGLTFDLVSNLRCLATTSTAMIVARAAAKHNHPCRTSANYGLRFRCAALAGQGQLSAKLGNSHCRPVPDVGDRQLRCRPSRIASRSTQRTSARGKPSRPAHTSDGHASELGAVRSSVPSPHDTLPIPVGPSEGERRLGKLNRR